MDYIYLNCIRYDYSIADGPGLRTLIFMQGCDLRCPFCQNEKIWDIKGGYKWSIKILINELKKNSITKKSDHNRWRTFIPTKSFENSGG